MTHVVQVVVLQSVSKVKKEEEVDVAKESSGWNKTLLLGLNLLLTHDKAILLCFTSYWLVAECMQHNNSRRLSSVSWYADWRELRTQLNFLILLCSSIRSLNVHSHKLIKGIKVTDFSNEKEVIIDSNWQKYMCYS